MAVSEVHLVWLDVPYSRTLIDIFSTREAAEEYAAYLSRHNLYADSLAKYTVQSLEVNNQTTISQS